MGQQAKTTYVCVVYFLHNMVLVLTDGAKMDKWDHWQQHDLSFWQRKNAEHHHSTSEVVVKTNTTDNTSRAENRKARLRQKVALAPQPLVLEAGCV
jgi:hypothetical protein